MLFNSVDYLIFFPVVVALYFAIPVKWRWLLLLIASYFLLHVLESRICHPDHDHHADRLFRGIENWRSYLRGR